MRARWEAIAWAALALVLIAVVTTTHRDYGITWDEGSQAAYGVQSLRYFRSGFREPVVVENPTLPYTGALVETLAAALAGGADRYDFEARHLLLALVGLLAIPGLRAFTALLAEGRAPLFAVLALFCMPRFYGHLFNNSKDVPFAVAVIGVWWALAAMLAKGDYRWRRVAACGALAGLALGVRPGGFTLLAGWGVVAAALAGLSARIPKEGPGPKTGLGPGPALVRVVAGIGIAWGVMVAVWPAAHGAWLSHPIEAMGVALRFPMPITTVFEGETFWSNELPRHYFLAYLLIATPPALLLLFAVGLVRAVRCQVAAPGSRVALVYAFAQLWLAAPLVAFSVARPRAYDGLRHFLFVLPALAVFAGVGAERLVALASRSVPRAAATAGALLLLLSPIVELVRLHPYQMTYFNAFVGGLRGAAGHYATDYWISSYREAMGWIAARAREAPGRRFRVLVGGNESLWPAAVWYAPANVETAYVGLVEDEALPEGVDYYLATTRYQLAENFPKSPVVHRVGREGAVFSVIRAPAP